MSAVDDVLNREVQRLADDNALLEQQNEHLAKLLAETLDVLARFQRDVNDELRHFQTSRNMRGYSWKKLLNR